MATQAPAVYQEQRTGLNGLIAQWDRRYRWQRTVWWLPRSLLLGLVLGITLFIIARVRPLLLAAELALITGGLTAISLGVMLGLVWLRQREPLAIARRFDEEFHLGERISTALELIDGQIAANDELTSYQIDDAVAQGQSVDPRHELPLQWDRNGWILVVVALIMLALLYFLPNPQVPVDAAAAATQAAIDEAAEDVEDVTETIAADPTLDEEQREQLLEQLEQTNSILEEEQVTPEEAFASLAEAQDELEEQAQALNQQLQEQQSALQEAAEALQQPLNNNQGASGAEGAIPALQEMQANLDDSTAEQLLDLANALEQAADQLEQTNPAAAEALRQAAEALRNGDMEAAQQAMQDAAQQMQQQQQQMQQQQQSAQQMQQGAQQMEQAANQVAQQSQQQQGQQQSGQQQSGEQQAGDQQSQSGEQPGQQGQQPSQQQGQQPGQPGDQEGQQSGSQSGQQPGDQSGEQGGQPGGEQAGQQSGEGQSQQPGTGSGAGDQQGNAGQDSDQAAGSGSQDQPSQNNNPDGAGTGQFAPIYAPQRAGGEGGPELFLEPDNSDVPLTEGEFAQNPEGQSLVPYNQVFSDYSNAANRALESDYIPLGLRDVVHDYFTSLEPGQ